VLVGVPLLARVVKMGIIRLAHRKEDTLNYCSVSLEIVRHRAVETSALAELRRPYSDFRYRHAIRR